MERMYVLKARKAVEDGRKLFDKCFCSVLDFANVERWDIKSAVPRSQVDRANLHLILVIANPALIWVGRRLWVRLKTISRNSCDVGTGAMSFHVVFILHGLLVVLDENAKGRMRAISSAQEILALSSWRKISPPSLREAPATTQGP